MAVAAVLVYPMWSVYLLYVPDGQRPSPKKLLLFFDAGTGYLLCRQVMFSHNLSMFSIHIVKSHLLCDIKSVAMRMSII